MVTIRFMSGSPFEPMKRLLAVKVPRSAPMGRSVLGSNLVRPSFFECWIGRGSRRKARAPPRTEGLVRAMACYESRPMTAMRTE
jgi:hypothetical protein